jgi:hypothetical protein
VLAVLVAKKGGGFTIATLEAAASKLLALAGKFIAMGDALVAAKQAQAAALTEESEQGAQVVQKTMAKLQASLSPPALRCACARPAVVERDSERRLR